MVKPAPSAPIAEPGGRVRRKRLRARFRTTPGRLRLFSVAAVAMLLLLWLTSAGVLSARASAARSVSFVSTQELMMANRLYARLADADATASRILLRSGGEQDSFEARERYEKDIAKAHTILIRLSSDAGSSLGVQNAAERISSQLATYVQRVESARVNNQLGNPVGAAYMRQASAEMRTEILPTATKIWRDAASRLHRDYRAGTDGIDMVLLTLVAATTVIVLIAAQVYTARRARRTINVGLAVATVLVVILCAVALALMNREQRALRSAQRDGTDVIQILSAARTLGLQAHANSSLALAENGTGADYLTEFDLLMDQLGGQSGRGGLLKTAHTLAKRTGDEARADELSAALTGYRQAHDRVRALDDAGQHQAAVELALSNDPQGEVGAARNLDEEFNSAIRVAEARTSDSTADARDGFGALAWGMTLGLLAAVVVALAGLQERIREYQ